MTRRSRTGLFILAVLVAAVCAGLGAWQGTRLRDRRAANRVALSARALAEADVAATPATDLPQRRVIARGRFDHTHTIILRGRVERQAPGVQVVVPLRLDGRAEAVLVNRGFVPSPNAATLDTTLVAPVDTVTVRGLALPVPDDAAGGSPLVYRGTETWQRLDRSALHARLPYPILDVYIHETEREPRPDPARPWPVPAALRPLDDGPHLSYMIQWFGIGAAALAFGVLFVLRGRPPKGTNSGQMV